MFLACSGRVNKNSNCTIFGQEIQEGLLQRRKRFKQFRLEVEKRQNEMMTKKTARVNMLELMSFSFMVIPMVGKHVSCMQWKSKQKFQLHNVWGRDSRFG
jgi:hypothetical protein